LARGNAQPGSIGADFGRLGIPLWDEVDALDAGGPARRKVIDQMNEWRNAIVHDDYDWSKLGGLKDLDPKTIRSWRRACHHLAPTLDGVTGRYIKLMTGNPPW